MTDPAKFTITLQCGMGQDMFPAHCQPMLQGLCRLSVGICSVTITRKEVTLLAKREPTADDLRGLASLLFAYRRATVAVDTDPARAAMDNAELAEDVEGDISWAQVNPGEPAPVQ